MRDLAELNVLINLQAELPEGLKLATDYFRDGWHRIRTGNAKRLEKKIRAKQWQITRSPKGISASGTGMLRQQAIVRAIDLALAEVCPEVNAIEVTGIQSTEYPWFWLARVKVFPYRIQQGPRFLGPEDSELQPERELQRRPPAHSGAAWQRFSAGAAVLEEELF
jgi:hypothetical protein